MTSNAQRSKVARRTICVWVVGLLGLCLSLWSWRGLNTSAAEFQPRRLFPAADHQNLGGY
jgi:hypothetical protein